MEWLQKILANAVYGEDCPALYRTQQNQTDLYRFPLTLSSAHPVHLPYHLLIKSVSPGQS